VSSFPPSVSGFEHNETGNSCFKPYLDIDDSFEFFSLKIN